MKKEATTSLSIISIGIITFIVFLTLKLCNQNNADFAWLTWFWVWFPLWAPIALELTVFLTIFIITFIVGLVIKE